MKDLKKKAKMDVLRDLHSEAKKMLKDDGAPDESSMEKVSVVAPDKNSLKEGLSKAQDMLDKHDMSDEQEPDGDLLEKAPKDDTEHELGDAADQVEEMVRSMDPDKMEKLIRKLQEMQKGK